MDSEKGLSSIEHKLDLLLQKNELDSSLEFYDDGNVYEVYLEKAPVYFPRDNHKGYCCYRGCYGEAKKYYDNMLKREGVLFRKVER